VVILTANVVLAAGQASYRFNIPQQRADKALTALARQAETQILFQFDVARQFDTNTVSGEYTIEEAITLLLKGTGLKAVFSEPDRLAIKVDEQSQVIDGEQKHMTKKLTFGGAVAAFFTGIFSAQGVDAQQAGTGATQAGAVLEEITVTARRIEERLQDTPISISAYTAEMLEKRQIISTEDLDKITPNLQFNSAARFAASNQGSVVFIRGIGQTTATANVDPGVGLYVDDVYMSQSIGGVMDFRDIESVQILRGPQGTLFGRNTIGGAVLLTTREPGDKFGGTFKLGTGSDALREVFVALDLPVNDTLGFRTSFGSRNRHGYVTRLHDGTRLGDDDNWTWTGKMVWEPTGDLKVKIAADWTEADENGAPYVFAALNTAATFPRVVSAAAGCPGVTFPATPAVPEINDPRCANNQWNAGPVANNGTGPVLSTLKNWGISLHVTYNVNDIIALKNIFSYRELDWHGTRDADNTPFPILHTDYISSGDQFSNEFQVIYNTDRLTGVAGFYFGEDETTDVPTITLAPPPFPNGVLDSDNNQVLNDNWAIFSQWTYDVMDNLSLTFGARYTEDTKGSIPDQFSYAAPSFNPATGTVDNPADRYLEKKLYEKTFSSTTFAGSVSYRWNENLMTYASYSEGFKGGGWNSNFNNPLSAAAQAQFQQFEDETAETIEVGFKADLLDNTLRFNGAFFTTDYTNLQFTFRLGAAPLLFNAGAASIDGFELELSWLPIDSVTIDAGLGYLDASIDEASTNPALTAVVTTDDVPSYTPEVSANFGVGYRSQPSGMGLVFLPRVDVSYTDSFFTDESNDPLTAQLDSYWLVDVSVGVENSAGDWRLIGGVSNLTDELYVQGGNTSFTTGSGYAEIVYAREREWFLTLSHDF
jgi:iron complex outermembrane receptor protein